jgi:AcrR family transcriptional regulator
VTVVTSSAGQAPPTAEAGAEFRQRLLDGMAAAIREHGYRESTIADIVRHARTSRRTFYEHFDSKEACYVALLRESNAEMIRQITEAVDPHAPWQTQVHQAIAAWLGAACSEPQITLSWIREIPSLGEEARKLQRDFMDAFIVMIKTLTDTPELRAAGVLPPSPQLATLLLGGLRELIATTAEDGADITSITDVAVEATYALLGPRS